MSAEGKLVPSFSWCKHLSVCWGAVPSHIPQKNPGKGKAGGLGAVPGEKLLKPRPAPAGLGEAAPPWELAAPAAPLPGTPSSQGPAQPGVPGLGKEPRGCSWTSRSLPARSGLQSHGRRLLSLFQWRRLGFPVLLASHPPGFRHLPGRGQHPDAGLQELGQPGDF